MTLATKHFFNFYFHGLSAGYVAHMGQGRNVYRVSVGEPEGKTPLERQRRRWEDGIKMDLREIGWGVWNGFTWLRIGIAGGLL
jgi:hypothetical protein